MRERNKGNDFLLDFLDSVIEFALARFLTWRCPRPILRRNEVKAAQVIFISPSSRKSLLPKTFLILVDLSFGPLLSKSWSFVRRDKMGDARKPFGKIDRPAQYGTSIRVLPSGVSVRCSDCLSVDSAGRWLAGFSWSESALNGRTNDAPRVLALVSQCERGRKRGRSVVLSVVDVFPKN